MSTNDNPLETEVKLVADPDALAGVLRRVPFAHAKSRSRVEHTTYFDTSEHSLRKRGLSLRLRRSGDAIVQTLKRVGGTVSIVGQREEWEWTVAGEEIALAPLTAVANRTGAPANLYENVRPIFATEIDRRAFVLTLDGGATKVEAVIDEGVVVADGRREPVCEVELEVKQGTVGPVFELALALVRDNGLRIGAESKADRGYRLLGADIATRTEEARSATIAKNARVGEALSTLSATALNAFVTDMPAARSGNVEAVHQMRVALRRVRSILVLFGPCLEPEATRGFTAAIRKMGADLGNARDWDVFAQSILDQAACDGVDEELLLPLRFETEKRREEAHAKVVRLIDGPRPTRMVLGLEGWLANGHWRGDGVKDDYVAKVLPDLLDRLSHKVKKRGKGLTKLSAPELHPLRKSVKKLRYAAEACTAIYGSKPVSRWVDGCKKLQALLGDINDATMAIRLLDALDSSEAARKAMRDWRDARIHKIRRKLARAWRKLEEQNRFWR